MRRQDDEGGIGNAGSNEDKKGRIKSRVKSLSPQKTKVEYRLPKKKKCREQVLAPPPMLRECHALGITPKNPSQAKPSQAKSSPLNALQRSAVECSSFHLILLKCDRQGSFSVKGPPAFLGLVPTAVNVDVNINLFHSQASSFASINPSTAAAKRPKDQLSFHCGHEFRRCKYLLDAEPCVASLVGTFPKTTLIKLGRDTPQSHRPSLDCFSCFSGFGFSVQPAYPTQAAEEQLSHSFGRVSIAAKSAETP